MGHKVNPLAFRLGVTKAWSSFWVAKKGFKENLQEDFEIRKLIANRFPKVGIERVDIERSSNSVKVIIFTSRPGFIIGKGGEGIENLRKDLEKKLSVFKPVKGGDRKIQIKIDVQELHNLDTYANLVAQGMAEQIEKRMPFRRVMKQALEKVMAAKGVKGVKVMVSGRLDGSEMSRTEWLASKQGRVPLHTLRADIDYGTATAFNTYGTVGVKVWIYKGEIFNK